MYAWRFKQLVADSTNEELVTQHPGDPSGSGVCRRDAMQFLFALWKGVEHQLAA